MDKYKALLKDLEEFRKHLVGVRAEYTKLVDNSIDFKEYLGKEVAYDLIAKKLLELINKHESK